MNFFLAAAFVLVLLLVLDAAYFKPRSILKILSVLLDGRARYGLELKKETGVHLNLYLHLASMEEDGLVSSRIDDSIDVETLKARGGIPRRLYTITPRGVHHLAKNS